MEFSCVVGESNAVITREEFEQVFDTGEDYGARFRSQFNCFYSTWVADIPKFNSQYDTQIEDGHEDYLTEAEERKLLQEQDREYEEQRDRLSRISDKTAANRGKALDTIKSVGLVPLSLPDSSCEETDYVQTVGALWIEPGKAFANASTQSSIIQVSISTLIETVNHELRDLGFRSTGYGGIGTLEFLVDRDERRYSTGEIGLRVLPGYIAEPVFRRGSKETVEHWCFRLFRHSYEVGWIGYNLFGPGELEIANNALKSAFNYKPTSSTSDPLRINTTFLADESNDSSLEDRFLVDGILPREEVVVLAGATGTGKSTLLSQLALTVAGHLDGPFVGQRVFTRGSVAVLSNEELAIDYAARSRRQTFGAGIAGTSGEPFEVLLLDRNLGSVDGLDRLLAEIEKQDSPVLIIIDSLRSVMGSGNENDAGEVSALMDRMYRVTQRTGATVILVHHTGKNARKSSAKELPRGSAVIMDRPRLVLGFSTDSIKSTLTVLNSNLLQIRHGFNISLKRDEETLTFVSTSSGMGIDGWTAERAAEVVLAIVEERNATAVPVFRSGGNSVYKLGDARLAGAGRAVIEQAILALIKEGHIASDKAEGLVVL